MESGETGLRRSVEEGVIVEVVMVVVVVAEV